MPRWVLQYIVLAISIVVASVVMPEMTLWRWFVGANALIWGGFIVGINEGNKQ